jgi:glycosyltransferase involved in cell wall biosynthesis
MKGTSPRRRVAVVYGVPAGAGGLGQQVASVIQALAVHHEVHAFGPGHTDVWPLPTERPSIEWHQSPPVFPSQFRLMRRYSGRVQLHSDRSIGRWAADEIHRLQPDLCYAFTQVALETLTWARDTKVSSVLESPNGHIRNFRHVNEAETRRFGAATFYGHPTLAMVERVEREYLLADRLRVSSQWSRSSMIANGVDLPISVFEQPLNLLRFHPSSKPPVATGPLKICFVGSVNLRKGFIHLLRAIRLVGPQRITLEIVGSTGDRLCKGLLAYERADLDLHCAPGDPVAALQRAELFVMPTLEDGSPFAVAEAMACGLPVIVTESCGAAEWIRLGASGWIVPPGSASALASALNEAISHRSELRRMGLQARIDTEQRAGLHCLEPFRRWLFDEDDELASCLPGT